MLEKNHKKKSIEQKKFDLNLYTSIYKKTMDMLTPKGCPEQRKSIGSPETNTSAKAKFEFTEIEQYTSIKSDSKYRKDPAEYYPTYRKATADELQENISS